MAQKDLILRTLAEEEEQGGREAAHEYDECVAGEGVQVKILHTLKPGSDLA